MGASKRMSDIEIINKRNENPEMRDNGKGKEKEEQSEGD